MKKHPNAPAEDQTKRKKLVPLSLEEYDRIHTLWEAGSPQVDIARLLERSAGTITHAIKDVKREDIVKREERKNRPPRQTKYNYKELEEVNLSKLPDTAFFEYAKEYVL